jgi:hypothetical protein
VTSSTEVKTRLDRIRLLVHRLNRVRDSALEAKIITQLTLETEAVDRARAAAVASTPANSASAANPHASDSCRSGPAGNSLASDREARPARNAQPARLPSVRRAGVRTRIRTVRRIARHG